MADTNPFANVTVRVWGEEPGATLNAVADPPATSVADAPDLETLPTSDVSEEMPPGDDQPEPGEVETQEGVEELEEPAQQQQQRRGRFDRRFSDLTKERNDALLAAAKAEGRAEALAEFVRHQALLTPQPGQQPAAEQPPQDGLHRDAQGMPQFPQEADYATTAAYHQAMHAYTVATAQIIAQQTLAQERAQEAQRTRRETVEAAVAVARDRYPNFDQLIAQSTVPFNPAMQQAINDSQHWPLVMAHLAQHPTEARALSNATLRDAVKAVERIEADLVPAAPAASQDEPQPRIATPPTPITPARGRSTVAAPRGLESLSPYEFFRQRNEEERALRRL
jgi:hypothetical protein